MVAVTVIKTKIFANKFSQYGASISEVLLAMAIVSVAMPFLYNQIHTSNQVIADIAIAKNITALRSPVLNYVRINQETWPQDSDTKIDADELSQLSKLPTVGFVDRYSVRGALVTDVYLAFDMGITDLRAARIARHIGADAAIVGPDGIAHGASWAVAAPDFHPGNLIYKISRDYSGQDKSIYLHRGTSGEDELNKMQRDLNMGGNNMYNIGTAEGNSLRVRNVSATFIDSELITSDSVYFSAGANLNGENAKMGAMRVTGDITGFRNITANKLNDNKYTTVGTVIADRATVTNSVNVAQDLILKTDSSSTISGFVAVSANSAFVPYISAKEITFYDNFGLTISGELMLSTTSPIKFGNWSFPSLNPPSFKELVITRATMPDVPDSDEFSALLQEGWRSDSTVNEQSVLQSQGL